MKLFSFSVFFTSFLIGAFLMYINDSPDEEILVYPSIDNYDKLLYKDNANHCFNFKYIESDCPNDTSKIKTIPIQ